MGGNRRDQRVGVTDISAGDAGCQQKLSPQPQERVWLGLLMANPLP
jgi:hypothetical protein